MYMLTSFFRPESIKFFLPCALGVEHELLGGSDCEEVFACINDSGSFPDRGAVKLSVYCKVIRCGNGHIVSLISIDISMLCAQWSRAGA